MHCFLREAEIPRGDDDEDDDDDDDADDEDEAGQKEHNIILCVFRKPRRCHDGFHPLRPSHFVALQFDIMLTKAPIQQSP